MELIPSHQKTGNAWRKIKPHKHHKHPSQAWYMTSIRLHHAGSLWWRSSMGLHGSATCCKFIEASNWSICQARNATFSDILSILSWFGGSFSVGECAFGVWHQIRTSWREIRNNRHPQCCTSGVCACTLRAVRRAVRLKTKKTSNIEQLSDSFVAMEFLNCGVASLLLLALCTHIIPLQSLQTQQTPQPLLSLLCLQPANACQLIAEHNLGSNHPKTGENKNISK